MEYVRLGTSGLKVSRICLGMMSFGSTQWRAWMLDEDQAEPIVRRAVEHGVIRRVGAARTAFSEDAVDAPDPDRCLPDLVQDPVRPDVQPTHHRPHGTASAGRGSSARASIASSTSPRSAGSSKNLPSDSDTGSSTTT